MKRQYARALISFAATGALSASYASAAWYEPFAYPASASAAATSLGNGTNVNAGSMSTFPGGGVGGNIWTPGGASPVNDADVAAGNLAYTGLPWIPVGNKVAVQAAAQRFDRIMVDQEYGAGSGGPTVFYSMLMRVSDMAGMTGTQPGGGFFTGLQYYPFSTGSDNMSNSSAGSAGPITIRRADPLNLAAGYELGVAFRDAPNANRIYGATDFLTTDTLLCVVKMEFGSVAAGAEDDVATLWVYKDNGTSADVIPLTEPTSGSALAQSSNIDDDVTLDYLTNTSQPASTMSIRSIIVRGGNTFIPNGLEVDEIRVGNTWEQAIGVPEPTGMALLGIGALGMLRRRK